VFLGLVGRCREREESRHAQFALFARNARMHEECRGAAVPWFSVTGGDKLGKEREDGYVQIIAVSMALRWRQWMAGLESRSKIQDC